MQTTPIFSYPYLDYISFLLLGMFTILNNLMKRYKYNNYFVILSVMFIMCFVGSNIQITHIVAIVNFILLVLFLHNVMAPQATIFVLYKISCFRAADLVFKVKLLRSFSISYKVKVK